MNRRSSMLIKSPLEQTELELSWVGKFIAIAPKGYLLSCKECGMPYKVEKISLFYQQAFADDGQLMREQLFCLCVRCPCDRSAVVPLSDWNLRELYPSSFDGKQDNIKSESQQQMLEMIGEGRDEDS